MIIKPLFDRVLIEPIENERITKSGIILPSTSQERPQTGKVIAIGSGVDIDNNDVGMMVKVGDKVLFNKYSGSEVKIEDKIYLLLRQIDLIAIIE
ncbi:MAG: co-chaperone GroES [Clostridia bacterium]|nr:co-chaperone GroES [Clostridia bacterium]